MWSASVADWSVARVGAAACAVVAVAGALLETPRAIDRLDAKTAHNDSLHFDDRAFAAGNSVIPDRTLLWQAKARIPSRGHYRVVLGDRPVANATNLTRYAAGFAAYFLLPRLQSADARWVLCIGCDPARLGALDRIWDDGAGSSLLEIR